jgi:hypothetical protein
MGRVPRTSHGVDQPNHPRGRFFSPSEQEAANKAASRDNADATKDDEEDTTSRRCAPPGAQADACEADDSSGRPLARYRASPAHDLPKPHCDHGSRADDHVRPLDVGSRSLTLARRSELQYAHGGAS